MNDISDALANMPGPRYLDIAHYTPEASRVGPGYRGAYALAHARLAAHAARQRLSANFFLGCWQWSAVGR